MAPRPRSHCRCAALYWSFTRAIELSSERALCGWFKHQPRNACLPKWSARALARVRSRCKRWFKHQPRNACLPKWSARALARAAVATAVCLFRAVFGCSHTHTMVHSHNGTLTPALLAHSHNGTHTRESGERYTPLAMALSLMLAHGRTRTPRKRGLLALGLFCALAL